MSDRFTLVDGERAVELPARVAGDRVRLDAAAVKDTLGWEVHDGLLCSDAMCVPVADEAALVSEAGVDLEVFARTLDRALAVDVAERAAFLGGSARERAQALSSQHAPDFTLPDLEGRPHALSQYRGTKILLVAWASW
jgi:hypothetical protein